MKQQVVTIHGGTCFNAYEEYLDFLRTREVSLEYFLPRADWKGSLQRDLGDDYEVLSPRMPDQTNAQYAEWQIWFERLTPFLADDVILIGHSLGGLFLIKYLSENNLSPRIKAVIIVAAPHDEGDDGEPLASFKLAGSLELFEKQAGKIIFYFSTDDLIVTPYHTEKYRQELPAAKFNIFADRRHFGQPEFPELIEEIKSLR